MATYEVRITRKQGSTTYRAIVWSSVYNEVLGAGEATTAAEAERIAMSESFGTPEEPSTTTIKLETANTNDKADAPRIFFAHAGATISVVRFARVVRETEKTVLFEELDAIQDCETDAKGNRDTRFEYSIPGKPTGKTFRARKSEGRLYSGQRNTYDCAFWQEYSGQKMRINTYD